MWRVPAAAPASAVEAPPLPDMSAEKFPHAMLTYFMTPERGPITESSTDGCGIRRIDVRPLAQHRTS
eukprot:1689658-Rhodomonas_salina.1